MHDRLVSDELAKTIADADRLLEGHQERKVSFLGKIQDSQRRKGLQSLRGINR